jgi:hypothetical protein
MVHGQRRTARARLDAPHIARMDAMERHIGKPAMALQALDRSAEMTTTQTIQERISSLASQETTVVLRPFLATRLRFMADSSNVSTPKIQQKSLSGKRL